MSERLKSVTGNERGKEGRREIDIILLHFKTLSSGSRCRDPHLNIRWRSGNIEESEEGLWEPEGKTN